MTSFLRILSVFVLFIGLSTSCSHFKKGSSCCSTQKDGQAMKCQDGKCDLKGDKKCCKTKMKCCDSKKEKCKDGKCDVKKAEKKS